MAADIETIRCNFIGDFKVGDNVVANAARVGNRRIGANPDAFVDAAPQMLGELAEEIAVNLRTGLGNVNKQSNFLCGRQRRSHRHSEQGQAGKK